jgi:hypothetical protein
MTTGRERISRTAEFRSTRVKMAATGKKTNAMNATDATISSSPPLPPRARAP